MKIKVSVPQLKILHRINVCTPLQRVVRSDDPRSVKRIIGQLVKNKLVLKEGDDQFTLTENGRIYKNAMRNSLPRLLNIYGPADRTGFEVLTGLQDIRSMIQKARADNDITRVSFYWPTRWLLGISKVIKHTIPYLRKPPETDSETPTKELYAKAGKYLALAILRKAGPIHPHIMCEDVEDN